MEIDETDQDLEEEDIDGDQEDEITDEDPLSIEDNMLNLLLEAELNQFDFF